MCVFIAEPKVPMVTGGHAYPNAPGKHFILERGNSKWSGVQLSREKCLLSKHKRLPTVLGTRPMLDSVKT